MTDVTVSGPGDTSPGPPADAITAIPVRHYGRWVAAAFVLLGVVLFLLAASKADVQYDVVPGYLTSDVILRGLRNTIIISVLAQLVGIALGVTFAVMRLSANPVLRTVSWFYIWFFRGTPVLVQLVFWYNLALIFPSFTLSVPFTDLTLISNSTNEVITTFAAALLGLGLNEGAYMAEIVRAGIISVDRGQTEAAHALGMTSRLTMQRIVLPQAMRVIVPPTGNEFISMLKTSSLAGVITYEELFRSAQNIYSNNLLVIELLLVVSIWYLVLTTIATWGLFYVERYFGRGVVETDEPFVNRLARNLTRRRRR